MLRIPLALFALLAVSFPGFAQEAVEATAADSAAWAAADSAAAAEVAERDARHAAGAAKAGDWKIWITWDRPGETATLARPGRDEPVRLWVLLRGADRLAGHQVVLRIRPEAGAGTAWSFRDTLGCAAADAEIAIQGAPGAPAPWQRPLGMNDMRRLDDGTLTITVAAAYDDAALQPDSVYALARIDLKPQAAAGEGPCAGWDRGATLLPIDAIVLLPGGVEAPVGRFGGPLRLEPAAIRR